MASTASTILSTTPPNTTLFIQQGITLSSISNNTNNSLNLQFSNNSSLKNGNADHIMRLTGNGAERFDIEPGETYTHNTENSQTFTIEMIPLGLGGNNNDFNQ